MREKGIPRFRSGDQNFVAACMSMGVPPDPASPCSVIQPEHGKPYVSWHLMNVTMDGGETTRDLQRWWASPQQCKCEPFTVVMNFIKAKPAGCRTVEDWLHHAHEFLAQRHMRTPDAPRSINAIPDFTKRRHDHLSAYVFAFVFNRREAARMGVKACPDLHIRRGRAWATVSANLDKKQAGELLARLKG